MVDIIYLYYLCSPFGEKEIHHRDDEKIELIEFRFDFNERRKKKKKTLPNSLVLKNKFLSLHPLLKGTPPEKASEKRSLDIYIHIL